jgi:hypothetical protein
MASGDHGCLAEGAWIIMTCFMMWTVVSFARAW